MLLLLSYIVMENNGKAEYSITIKFRFGIRKNNVAKNIAGKTNMTFGVEQHRLSLHHNVYSSIKRYVCSETQFTMSNTVVKQLDIRYLDVYRFFCT